jgi:CheY-like chemotaxis protein
MRAEQEDPLILVVEAVEETRDGIEKLLKTDGYRIDPARNEQDAVANATRKPPDLLLVSLGCASAHVIEVARRIRDLRQPTGFHGAGMNFVDYS